MMKNEHGATLIVFVFLVLMATFAGIAWINLGAVRTWKVEAQRTADSAALAGAWGFIDGDEDGDSAIAWAQRYVWLNPVNHQPPEAVITVDAPHGVIDVMVRAQVHGLLFAPRGAVITAKASAQAKPPSAGGRGTPVPKGNAYGWWTNHSGGHDSATVALIR